MCGKGKKAKTNAEGVEGTLAAMSDLAGDGLQSEWIASHVATDREPVRVRKLLRTVESVVVWRWCGQQRDAATKQPDRRAGSLRTRVLGGR